MWDFLLSLAVQEYHHAQAVNGFAVLRSASPLRVTRLARGDDAEGVGTRNVFKFRHACGASNKERSKGRKRAGEEIGKGWEGFRPRQPHHLARSSASQPVP